MPQTKEKESMHILSSPGPELAGPSSDSVKDKNRPGDDRKVCMRKDWKRTACIAGLGHGTGDSPTAWNTGIGGGGENA